MSKAIDWEAIEASYRAGLLSVREIASQHGITHGAINKRAKRDGWERNLKAKIHGKADAIVSREAVSAKVSSRVSSGEAVTERVLIEANAEVIADIRLRHRSDIARIKSVLMDALGEIECPSLLEGEKLDTPKRIRSIRDVAETMKVLVNLERQAYGIDEAQADKTVETLSDLMDELSKEA